MAKPDRYELTEKGIAHAEEELRANPGTTLEEAKAQTEEELAANLETLIDEGYVRKVQEPEPEFKGFGRRR